jgi:hypothetical protein
MPFYVYIIRSLKDNSYYKGFTENYERRLEEHNQGLSKYTAGSIFAKGGKIWCLTHVNLGFYILYHICPK